MKASEQLAAGTLLGNYEIKRLLGRGGMGAVYLATDQRLGREIAIKVLPPEFAEDPQRLARFQREARSAALLNHSNICTIHEIGEANGVSFICMEYIEGITLQNRITSGPMAVEEILDIAIQIADALDEAWKKNIVHRDMKSLNVLLTSKNRIKVLDFGLAKQLANSVKDVTNASTESKLTESGIVIGTATYMSPEQALGHEVDHRSDLFSFGVVLYEMLTGRLPFTGSTTTELLDAILHKEPPAVARYNERAPDPLIRLVNKMLEKDREERYQTAHDVWVDLRRIRKEVTGISSTQAVAARKTWPVRWVAAGLIVVLLVVAGILWKSKTRPPVSTQASWSLVALPCKVYGSPDVQYLSEAVPGTLSTLLAQVDGLETKMPPTNDQVLAVHGDLDKIAEAYQVNSLLVSSITAEPNRFVLNVQLVEARSKKMIWSNEFEGTPGGYIELTRQAAEGIRNQLRPESKSAVSTSELPKNSEAELLFRQGKYFVNRYNNLHDPADFNLAYSTLTRALDLEPRLADAAAEIANLYSFQAETQGDAGEHTEDSIEQSKNWARRAFEMNPQCARALSQLARTKSKREGIELALRAIQLAPNDALAQNGLFFLSHDSLVLVVAMRKEANRLDPLYLYPYMNVAYMLKILGKPDEGLPYIERALQLEPDFGYGLYAKSILLLDLHRKQEASVLLKRIEKLVADHRLPDYILLILKTAFALEERNDQAVQAGLARVKSMVNDPKASGHDLEEIALDLVPWLAKYGRNEEALHILDAATKRGGVPYDWLMICPQLSSLRDDPRFQNALATARPQFLELITLLQEARSRKMLPAYLEAPLAQLTAQLNITKQAAMERSE